VHALAEAHRARGFELVGFTDYDPNTYPAEWHTDADGNALPLTGSASYTILDPDGNQVMFDTVPVERARQQAGERFCNAAATGELLPEQEPLGRHDLCLSVKDVGASIAFYRRLGLSLLEDHSGEGWAILGSSEPNEFRLALYQGHLDGNCMNFRGEDVFAVAERLKAEGLTPTRGPETEGDGSAGAWYTDPEGNAIYLNTAPGESTA
jgi:catechol 2,3-dioxygenase-like lactoylglutathione lyase family enzyme